MRAGGSGHPASGLLSLVVAAATVLAVFLPSATWASRAPSPAGAQGGLAQVRWIAGGLSVRPPHGRARKAALHQRLFSGYAVSTGSGQMASLGFSDGSLLQVHQQTRATLRSAALTTLAGGELAEDVVPGSHHAIQTPLAQVVAHGTFFDVQSTARASTIWVLEGAVLVSNRYGSALVKTGQRTVVLPGKAPTSPKRANVSQAVAWTQTIPPPPAPLGQNIALDANGGKVIDASSQSLGWDARFAVDGNLDTGWASAARAISHQWITLKFHDNADYLVSGVVIDPAATRGHLPSSDLKDFLILVSTAEADDGSFTIVLRGTCRQANSLQRFDFSQPVPARYVQLLALDNYGNPNTVDVAEFEVVAAGQAQPSPTATSTVVPTSTPVPTTAVQPTATATPTLAPATGTPVSPLTIITPSLPGGQVGESYSAQLEATGGVPPYAWTLVSGPLPPGLQLSLTGLISGTPNTPGFYRFSVQVVDSMGDTASRQYTINVVTTPANTPTNTPVPTNTPTPVPTPTCPYPQPAPGQCNPAATPTPAPPPTPTDTPTYIIPLRPK